MVERSMADSRLIFNKYDTGSKGFIVYADLCALFEDLGLKEKFKYHFDEFMKEQMKKYDLNLDGVISYEEFVKIHNELIELEFK